MKIRFDTNTKSVELASHAFIKLSNVAQPKDLNLSLNTWGDLCYSINGEVDSKHATLLEELFGNDNFNEDTNLLWKR